MTASLIVILFFHLLAPGPDQIAINLETKECGYYWGGDEYSWYQLSDEWVIFDVHEPIYTDAGVYEWDGFSSMESLCKEMGYIYVPGNVGESHGESVWTPYSIMLVAVRLAPFIAIFVVLLIALILFLRWLEKKGRNTTVP
jgi:hypothetical protein